MRRIVEKIGAILALFSFSRSEWGVGEIATALEIPKSTISEILTSLTRQGMLERTSRGRYRLGWRCFELHQVLLASNPLVSESRSEMQSLIDRYGESSHLMVLDKFEAVIVERLHAAGTLALPGARVGLRVPAHCSACGKILLASNAWVDVERWFQGEIPARTVASIQDLDALRGELQTVRTRGLAYDRDESVIGLSCIAAPVRNDAGKVVAAVSIAVPSHRFDEELRVFEQRIQTTAERISGRLGYRGTGRSRQGGGAGRSVTSEA